MSCRIERKRQLRRARELKRARQAAAATAQAVCELCQEAERRERALADALWRGSLPELERFLPRRGAELLLAAEFVESALWADPDAAWALALDAELDLSDEDADAGADQLEERLRRLPQCPLDPREALVHFAAQLDDAALDALHQAAGWDHGQ